MRKEILYSVVKVFTLGIVIASLLLAAGCRGEDWEELISSGADCRTAVQSR